MTADLSDFDARLPKPKPTKLDRILTDLADTDPKKHKDLTDALHNTEKYDNTLIARTMTEDWDIPISQHTVRIWRHKNV